MAKYRVAVIGTVGKSVLIDDSLSSRVAALETQITTAGGVTAHSALTGLQQSDDHPQYTMWAAPETIKAPWNFQTIPYIQGETLAEYIEDVVAGGSDPFIADSPSITWTYDDTGNHLQADVVDEYVEDLVGSMLVNTTYIDLDYGDSDGSIKAILDTGAVLDLIGGGAFQDSSTIDFTYDSGTKRTSAAVVQSFSYSWTGNHTWADNAAAKWGDDGDLSIYHDSTNSVIANHTGILQLWNSDSVALAKILSLSATPTLRTGVFGDGTVSSRFSVDGAAGALREIDWRSAGVQRWILRGTSTTEAGGNSGTHLEFIARADDGSNIGTVMRMERASLAVRMMNDNQEFQIGAGSDLRLSHDGTNSVIENDTGNLILRVGGELDLEEVTTSTGANVPAIGTNKPGSAVALTPATWLTVIVNGATYYVPLWQ